MILYFSGTGNSQYAAEKLLEPGERLVSLAELMKKKEYVLELGAGEKLGIVFPVYFYTLPSIVREYLEKAEIRNASYVYSVITCGGGTGQASAVLKKLLKKKGIRLDYFHELLMPDNSMLFYQIPEVEEADGRLDDALLLLAEIKADITAQKRTKIGSNTMLSNVLNQVYRLASGTGKFRAEDACIGCGLCERNCPQEVIRMVDGKPEWQKEQCCKCSACINRCPVNAIQYGKGTRKRNRYVNPRV